MPHPTSLCYALSYIDENNKFYFGDNLRILREYVPDASVDLIQLDPPFNSQATYNVLFKEKTGEESAAQIMASEGTSVAPLYERRPSHEEKPAGVDRGYSGRRPRWEAVYNEIVTRGPRKLAEDMKLIEAGAAR